ncbi:MAG: EamA family transporter [Tenericutes bacterium HGW-Tenericutes-1]|jgi:drug/metabolite transporter (DMT)-like permease|nr:MAG: EamA family transporter [Tenericutes bacterium HGW-Tenericutes-1]
MKLIFQNKRSIAILFAIMAAILYGFSSPLSKLLLVKISPYLMASLLYFGAGIGMFFVNLLNIRLRKDSVKESKLSKKDLPYTIGMILLDILAPILLMIGLTYSNASNVSLLNNFEIVATTFIAMLFFKESIGKRMAWAIVLIVIAGVVLSFEDINQFQFSIGSLFVIGASICWGLENNFTRMLSLKNSLQIVVVKGLGSGLGSLIIAITLKQLSTDWFYIIYALLLGFVAYGMSLFFYIRAQRDIGATRTATFYAAAPFVGVILSIVILSESITIPFLIALAIMLFGSYLAVSEKHGHFHIHEILSHDHLHNHNDLHHTHTHDDNIIGEHSHNHSHDELEHTHPHTPDTHHKHQH